MNKKCDYIKQWVTVWSYSQMCFLLNAVNTNIELEYNTMKAKFKSFICITDNLHIYTLSKAKFR